MTETQDVAKELADNLAEWRAAISGRIDKLEKGLAENTVTTNRVDANTSELVGILNSWKGAMTVLDFLGRIAKPVAALIALGGAWFAWRGGK